MSRAGHVLFITVDQWRGDSLGCVGHPMVRTPNLDALAAQGVLFANHFANIAPCAPSRASLYTGLYAHHHRVIVNGTPLDDRHQTVAKLARAAGYSPTLFGYTDSAVDPRTVAPDDPRLYNYEGILPGFDVGMNDPDYYGRRHWAAWVRDHGIDLPDDPDQHYAPIPDYAGAENHGETWAPTRFPKELTETAFMIECVTDWLDQRSDQDLAADPFFIHLSLIRPHPPYRNPEGYHDLYDADDVPAFSGFASREEELAFHPLPGVAIGLDGVGAAHDELDRRQQRATYHAMQTEVDDQLGRLFAHLRDRGLWDDTLVVLTSDHGEMGGDHHLLQKLGYWDESYHVPLIVRDPRPSADTSRGRHFDEFTESVDVLPTILEWIGVSIPDTLDGRSLAPFAADGAAPDRWRDEVFWEWHFSDPEHRWVESLFGIPSEWCSLTVVRTRHHKLVQFAAPEELLPSILIDLEADPDHTVNHYRDPGARDALIDCLERVGRWRMRSADRTLSGHFLSATSGHVHRIDPR
ncbi:MAG: sulfatase-like hydrolase/transferase [Microthrixaceae bacterium]